MLELTEIQYMAGEKTVLQNVTAGFPAGQVTGIVGPNGAGKSSLLRIASGLVAASGGDIAAAGAFADTAWRARNIAYMPQFQTVAWPLRAREIVGLGLLPLHLSAAQSAARIDAALARCGVSGFADRRIDTLSGGEQARVFLARLLATGATIMLLDEPVQSLDPAGALAVMALLRAEAAQGKAVAVVLHELNLAQQFCDKLVVMKNGTVALAGDAQHVLSPARLRPIFGVEFEQLAGRHLVPHKLGQTPTAKKAKL